MNAINAEEGEMEGEGGERKRKRSKYKV